MYESTMFTQASLQQNTPPTNNYLLGKQDAIERLDAKKAKRGKRKRVLKCKPGYKQRGAVCQKQKFRKAPLTKSKRASPSIGGVPLIPILKTALTTAALTGVAKIGSKAAQLNQVTQDKDAELRKAKLKQDVAIATAVGAVGVAGVVSYKPLKEKSLKEISDLSLLGYEKLTSIKDIDQKIDNLDNISDERKAQLKNLAGDLKGFALAAHLRASQAKVIKIDEQANVVHYQAKDGSIISRGKIGSNSLLMRMNKNHSLKLQGSIPIYESDFMLDGNYDREEDQEKKADKDTRRKNIKIARKARQMYFSQTELIEDEAVIYGVVNGADDAYDKRYNLYTRQGLIDTPPVEKELKKLIRTTTPEKGVAAGTVLFDYKIKGEVVKGKRQKDVHLKNSFRLSLNKEESDFVAAQNRVGFQEKTIKELEKKKTQEKGLSNLDQRRLNNLKEQQKKALELISKFDSRYIASLERQFNLVPSLMSENYILAHQEVVELLDARRKKRKKPLKCKPGFVQRGAVCQPKKTKKKANLKTATFLTASTLAAAALLYKKSQKVKPSPYPVEIEKIAQKKGLKLNNASKAAIATVAIGGISAGGYLAARKRYRDGFPESAAMAEERAKSIQLGKVKARQKVFLFGVGGAAFKEESASTISGERIILAGKLAFSRKKGRDFKSVPIDNSATNYQGNKRGNKAQVLKEVLNNYWIKHKARRSQTAVNLAANVIAYADKYPDRSLVMIGHSMGGFDVHEAQEILRVARPELKDRLISFAFGSEYMGFTEPYGEDHTIGSPHDIFTDKLPTRNLTKFSGVEGHSQSNYFLDSEVQKFVQDRIYRITERLNKKQDAIEKLDARRKRLGKRPLRCKPGFVQRGAVCQPKKPRQPKKLRKNLLKKTALALAGTAAIAKAGVIVKKISLLSPSQKTKAPLFPPQNTGKQLITAAATGVGVGAGVGAGITYAVARNQRQKAVEEIIAEGEEKVAEMMISHLKDRFKQKTAEVKKEAQLNGQIRKLQADLETINNRNTKAQQELDAANNRISRLEKAEQAGASKVKKLSQELDTVVSSKNKTTEELQTAKSALSQAEGMVASVRSQRDNLNNMVRDLETQLESTRTQKEQELSQLQSQLSELENQRTQLSTNLKEQETKLEELDRQSAATLKSRLADQQKQFEGQLQAKQQELEDEIARGSDPKPKKGQSARRGDLIATESGVSLGASHRWGSNFFNLSPPEQQTKLQNKVNQLLDKSYGDRLLGLQRDFTERVQSTTPKKKQPYPRLSELATTVNVKDKTLIKELKGQEKELLPRLVSLEKDVAQHNLREEILEYVQQATGEQLRQNYRELLENFQAFAVDEGGSYSPGAINNDLLKDFDSQSQSLVKNYNSSLDGAISKIISPKFAKQVQQTLSEYIEEAPTEEIVMRKRKQVALKLSEKILTDIFNLRAR